MKRLVITGASGFLGRYLARAAVHSYDVLGTYFQHHVSIPGAKLIQCDLTNPSLSTLRDFDPDYVFHCAGLPDVDVCETSPRKAERINKRMAGTVARFASETDAHLTHISTDAVFDGSRPWWSETDDPDPINVYGETKLAGEHLVRRHCDGASIVRTNFFGWNRPESSSLAEWMLKKLRAGESLPGFGDIYFTPLYAGDLARYLLDVSNMEYSGTLHLAGTDRISKSAFATELADVFDLNQDLIEQISITDAGLDAPRGNDLSLDSSKAEACLETTLPNIRTGLERMKQEKK